MGPSTIAIAGPGVDARGHVTGASRTFLIWLVPLLYPLCYPTISQGMERVRAGAALGLPLVAIGLAWSLVGPLAAWLTLNYLDKNNFDRRQYRIVVLGAMLTAANPPLYNVIGNVTTQFHIDSLRLPAWYLISGLALAAAFLPTGSVLPVVKYRRIHGYSAMLVFTFAIAHVFNHLMAIISLEAHQTVLRTLRLVYRERFIEIALVGAVIVQVVTGLTMVWKSHLRRVASLRNLQTVSGIYMAIFFVSHLRATFLARFHDIDPTFGWATHAPAGVLAQASSIGLLPYYILSVIMLFVHLGCQARWNLGGVMSPSAARNLSYGLMGIGGVAALTIALAACGMHVF